MQFFPLDVYSCNVLVVNYPEICVRWKPLASIKIPSVLPERTLYLLEKIIFEFRLYFIPI